MAVWGTPWQAGNTGAGWWLPRPWGCGGMKARTGMILMALHGAITSSQQLSLAPSSSTSQCQPLPFSPSPCSVCRLYLYLLFIPQV